LIKIIYNFVNFNISPLGSSAGYGAPGGSYGSAPQNPMNGAYSSGYAAQPTAYGDATQSAGYK